MTSRSVAVGLVLSVVPIVYGIDPKAATPPVAAVKPHPISLHGDTRVDDYFWLAEKKNPDVVAYLEAENAYTAAVMKPLDARTDALYKEMRARIKQTDDDVPYKDRGFWYYTRTVEGKQYKIYCRKKGTLEAPEEVMLDGNELAKGHKYFDLDGFRVSDDGNLLAFAADVTGNREFGLSVKDLRTGKLLENAFVVLGGVSGVTFEWAADGLTLLYVTDDPARRPNKLWAHRLGRPKDTDTLVFEEKDELFSLAVSRSRDGKFLFHSSTSFTTGEQSYTSADNPTGHWRILAPRREGHEYSADHGDGVFYIRSNKDRATNFKVMTSPVGSTDPSRWTDLIPYDPAVYVEGVAVFKRHAVISVRTEGVPRLIVRDLATGATHHVSHPEAAYHVALNPNPEFDTAGVQFTYSSYVTPESVFEYDLTSKARKLLKQNAVLGGYDPGKFEIAWEYAPTPDGVKVPVSLVYKKGMKRDGTAPCWLYGYGSYGNSTPVEFDSNRVSLLDRGVVFATAHVRGGSELGRTWYDDGKMQKKKNSFSDFVAAADFLVSAGYCSRNRLAIHGESAGGLLIGATLNLRPDLCKTALLQVPFVDALTTMSDADLPLTTQEWKQWGNPNVKRDYEYMRSYCPYTNLKKMAYPSILVTTSLNDSQIMYHEPAKYVAKLRTLKTDSNPLLFKCQMTGGHDGPSGRYDALREQAFVTAFVLDQIGVKE
jgi:oligopeptidase B